MDATDRTTYQGHAVDRLTRQILDAANTLLALDQFGGETEPATMSQGSWSHASASAGTHSGGAAFDMTAHNWRNRVKVFRLLGVAYFDRPYRWRVWPHHGHGIVCGMGNAAPLARSQVVAYYNGRNGLANNGPDKDWRPEVFPLAIFAPGDVRFVRERCHAHTQPSTHTPPTRDLVPREIVRVLMWVNVGGRKWAATNTGDFIRSKFLGALNAPN